MKYQVSKNSSNKVWNKVFETESERVLKEIRRMLTKSFYCEHCGYHWRRKWRSSVECPKCSSSMILYKNGICWEWVNT